MTKKSSRQLKVYSLNRYNKEVPELRLSGTWIAQLGFKVGEMVNITVREKLLIIELVEETQEEIDYKIALQEVRQTFKKIS